jgi:hypothetical protein
MSLVTPPYLYGGHDKKYGNLKQDRKENSGIFKKHNKWR